MHHLDYSTFLTLTSLLLLNRFFNTDSIKLKSFYFIYFLFVTSNLFLNGGRTGHLAFAIAIFAVGFTNIKNKFKAFFSILFLIISIFYAAYHISPVFKTRFDTGANELVKIEANSSDKYHGSFGTRLGLWVIGVDLIKNEPFFGNGIGDNRTLINNYVLNGPKEFKTIKVRGFHNEYIETLVQLGFIGLIIYLLILYNLYYMKISNKSISNLKIIFLAVFCVASTVENIFHNQFTMSLFSLFVGIFIVFRNQDKYY
jgi:O-antigen ligase